MKIFPFLLSFLSLFLVSCQSSAGQDINESNSYRPLIDSSNSNNKEATDEDSDDGSTDLKIIMIPLETNGDCFLIDYGDTEILIDAGGNKNSTQTIRNTIEEYVDDNKLEMIIITHSDNDHLVSFAADNGVSSWLSLPDHSCDYLIDFDIIQDRSVDMTYKNNFFKNETDNNNDAGDEDEVDSNPNDLKTPYSNYIDSRKLLIDKNIIKNYLTASECTYSKRGITKEKLSDRAQTTAKPLFFFDAKGNEVSSTTDNALSLQILYNYYYDHPLDNGYDETHIPSSCELNLLSVCCLLEYDQKKYLFTGDLMEYNSAQSYKTVYGETYLVEHNSELKEGVYFYKAAHHGSMTSNSPKLLDVLRPQYIAIDCVIANEKYDFPKDTTLRSMMKWTDKIYITHVLDDAGNVSNFHGSVVFRYNGSTNEMVVSYSNPQASNSLFDSDLIHRMKELSFSIYNLSAGVDYAETECTYIKLGSIDILVNCGGYTKGSTSLSSAPIFLDKIKYYCNDGILDYIILSGGAQTNIVDLIGPSPDRKDGLLFDDYFTRIGHIYLNKTMFNADSDLHSRLEDALNSDVNEAKIGEVIDQRELPSNVPICSYQSLTASFHFLNYATATFEKNTDLASVPFVLEVNDFRYLNLGRLTDENEQEFTTLFITNLEYFKANKADVFTVPKFGYSSRESAINTRKYIKDAVSLNGDSCFLFPGNYGTKNLEDKFLYPCEYYRNTEGIAEMSYASTIQTDMKLKLVEEDLRVVVVFKKEDGKPGFALHVRSKRVDSANYTKFDQYAKASALPVSDYI